MTVDHPLRNLIVDGANAMAIEHHAVEAGMDTLATSAMQKILRKETTLDEVLRHVDLGHPAGAII
jgi:type II secretory ATPase GspE/PulE/Tfp pilus assembly ATPase PilB-like protein